MDLRQLTSRLFVSPQLTPADMPALAEAGFVTVICNRPDTEVTEDLQTEAMRAAAMAAGLRFEVLELVHQTLTPENAAVQSALIETAGDRVVAYCRSGTRCSVIWALGQLGERSVDDVMAATRAAGYNLDSYLPLFEQVAQATA